MSKENILYTAHPETISDNTTLKAQCSDNIIKVIDAATLLTTARLQELAPNQIEKPLELNKIIEAVNSSLNEIYPKSENILNEQVFWLSKQGFEYVYTPIPGYEFFTNKALEAIGGKNLRKSPYSTLYYHYHARNIEPPITLLDAETFNSIGKNELPNNKIRNEYRIIKTLTQNAIEESSIPRKIAFSDQAYDVFNKMLNTEFSRVLKHYPTIDKNQFKTLLENYKTLLNDDPDSLLESDGAALWFISRFGNSDERIMGVGISYNFEVVDYLARKPLANAINIYIENYPEEKRKYAKRRFDELYSRDGAGKAVIRQFFKSIDIGTESEAFNAFQKSNIAELFLEKKKKHPHMTYPR